MVGANAQAERACRAARSNRSRARKDARVRRESVRQIARHSSCHTQGRPSCIRLRGSKSRRSIRSSYYRPPNLSLCRGEQPCVGEEGVAVTTLHDHQQGRAEERHLRCRVFRRTSPDCGWLPSNQRLGEVCGGATDGQTGRYGVFTVSKCESFLLRRLGVSTGRWGGNLGFKAREVGKRPKCRVSWGKEKNPPPASPLFQRLSEQRKWLEDTQGLSEVAAMHRFCGIGCRRSRMRRAAPPLRGRFRLRECRAGGQR